ncbi:hypothetical protein C0992_004096, partial [Termitomyces sp. T32_za158]
MGQLARHGLEAAAEPGELAGKVGGTKLAEKTVDVGGLGDGERVGVVDEDARGVVKGGKAVAGGRGEHLGEA